MGQILKFPNGASRRSKNRTFEKVAGTVTEMPSRHVPVMTGNQWDEFIRLLTPDEQQAFMSDLWKLVSRHCYRIGGE
jgi:hypothetical protein